MYHLNLADCTQDTWNQFHFYSQQGTRNELMAVALPGLPSPLYLRRSTKDIDNFRQIYIEKEYDLPIETPETILDLGGYIGLASAYFAQRYPDSRITLVEPDPDNYLIARLNSRQFTNIQCLNVGVWSKACELTIAAKIDGDWGTVVRELEREEESSMRIKAMSVPDIMRHTDTESFDFIKIDIEGSEKEIFSDPTSRDWIRKAKTISCELHDRIVEGCSKAFHSAIACEGFIHGRHGEFDFYIKSNDSDARAGDKEELNVKFL